MLLTRRPSCLLESPLNSGTKHNTPVGAIEPKACTCEMNLRVALDAIQSFKSQFGRFSNTAVGAMRFQRYSPCIHLDIQSKSPSAVLRATAALCQVIDAPRAEIHFLRGYWDSHPLRQVRTGPSGPVFHFGPPQAPLRACLAMPDGQGARPPTRGAWPVAMACPFRDVLR